MRSFPHMQSIIIVSILLIILFGLQLRIFTGEDLALVVTPSKISINTTTGSQEQATFTITKQREWCKATCTYEFNGKDAQEKGNFSLSSTHDLTFTITAPNKGFGQDAYNLHLQCTNTKTLWCRTSGEEIEESRLVLVHYEPEQSLQLKVNQIKREMIGAHERLMQLKGKLHMLSTWDMTGMYTQEREKTEEDIEHALKLLQEYATLYNQQEFENLASSFAPHTQEIYLLTQNTETLKLFLETQPYQLLNTSTLNQTLYTAVQNQEEKNKKTKETRQNELEHICSWFVEVCSSDEIEQLVGQEASEHKETQESITEEIVRTTAYGKQLCLINETAWFREKQAAYQEQLNHTIVSWFTENNLLEWYENKTLFAQVLDQTEQWKENTSTQSIFKPIFPLLITYEAKTRTCESVPPLITQVYLQKIEQLNYSAAFIAEPPLLPQNGTLDLQETQTICCVRDTCAPCCSGEECNTPTMYPILLLHGHALNARSSPEYSLDSMIQIQRSLEEEGYVNGGILLPRAQRSLLDAFPFSFRTTYYIDVLVENGTTYVPANSQSISTYALRLHDIIQTAKEETQKEKVIIIAHSMGGLVARQYLQTFGEESVYMLITIGTPNQGITEDILRMCTILGEKQECTDMTQGSIFLRKLGTQNINIPVHTIIGTGCTMRQGDGDGIVLTDAAKLAGTTTHTIRGTCTASMPLHTEMLKPNKYPEVIEIISSLLPS